MQVGKCGVLALWVLVLSIHGLGCAALKVSVDVYRGELILTDEARLADAVGLATTVHLNLQRILRDGAQEPNYIAAVKNAFDTENIETHWNAFKEASDETLTKKAGKKLSLSLMRFAGGCVSAGRSRGIPEAIRIKNLPFLGLPSWPALHDGISLEEAGRWIMFLVDGVPGEGNRTTIARVMQSVSRGHTGSLLEVILNYGLGQSKVSRGLDRTYWSSINPVRVFGVGEVKKVIVKDDIGNWHIKSMTADQSEIINTIFDGVEVMVDLAAAQFGVRAGGESDGGDSEPPSGDIISKTYIDRKIKADAANRVKRSLHEARLTLQVRLSTALMLTDRDELKSAMSSAAEMYVARVDGLELDGS